MKNKFLQVLCLTLLFFYFNCEKDDSVIKEEQIFETSESQQVPTIKTVSFDNVSEKFNRLKDNYHLDGFLHSSLESNTLSRTIDTLGVTIYTDNIKEITLGDYTSYTMRITLPDSDSNKFYNLTIEDKNGEEGMFMTKYTPTENWQNNTNQAYEGGISTNRMEVLTNEFPPDGGGDIETGNNNPSEEYPEDCNGTVIPTTIMEEYPCGCGHSYYQWQIGQCSGSSCGDPFLPGHRYVTTYECWEYNDPDPSDPSTGGTNPGGGTNPSGQDNDGSYTTIVTENGECEIIPPPSLNGDCIIDDYELLIFQLGISDSNIQDFIIHNTNIADVIITALNENGSFNEAMESVMEAYYDENPSEFIEALNYEIQDEARPIQDIDTFLDCFNDGKETAFYSFIVYVDQPVDGTRNVFNYSEQTPGHTFFTLLKMNTDGTEVTQTIGFYPKNNEYKDGTEWDGPGIFQDNGFDGDQHIYNVSITFEDITESQFQNIISDIQEIANSDYDLDDNNCTNVAHNLAVNNLGFSMNPSTSDIPILPGAGACINPGDYGEDLKEMDQDPNSNHIGFIDYGANDYSDTALTSDGPCN